MIAWLFRGVFAIALLVVPLVLSIRSCLRDDPPGRLLPLDQCPPTAIVPLGDVARYPSRYRFQEVWTMGRLEVQTTDCLTHSCQGKTSCCAPCRARLFLQEKNARLPIRGLLDGKPLFCEASTCGLRCDRLVEKVTYAIAGTTRTLFKLDPFTHQPAFLLREFWVSHLCKPSDPSAVPRHPSLADPLHRPSALASSFARSFRPPARRPSSRPASPLATSLPHPSLALPSSAPATRPSSRPFGPPASPSQPKTSKPLPIP